MSTVRAALRRHLTPLWVRLRRLWPTLKWLGPAYWPRLTYAQDGEDIILEHIFQRRRGGFYVDVGAFHPRVFSNTHLLHRRHGWLGINIDPAPGAIERFRRARPHDINLAVAIGPQAGTATLRRFEWEELNTLSLEHARQYRDWSEPGEAVTVPVMRLDTLFAEHLPTGQVIDLLDVDVEGLDLAVLQSNDWQRFRPRVVCVECLFQTVAQAITTPVHQLLEREGYTLYVKTTNNCIYVLFSQGDGSAAVRLA